MAVHENDLTKIEEQKMNLLSKNNLIWKAIVIVNSFHINCWSAHTMRPDRYDFISVTILKYK